MFEFTVLYVKIVAINKENIYSQPIRVEQHITHANNAQTDTHDKSMSSSIHACSKFQLKSCNCQHYTNMLERIKPLGVLQLFDIPTGIVYVEMIKWLYQFCGIFICMVYPCNFPTQSLHFVQTSPTYQ